MTPSAFIGHKSVGGSPSNVEDDIPMPADKYCNYLSICYILSPPMANLLFEHWRDLHRRLLLPG